MKLSIHALLLSFLFLFFSGSLLAQTEGVVLPDSAYYCEADSVELNAGNHISYFWSTGETTQSIIVSSTGNYVVTVTDANGTTVDSTWVYEVLTPIAMFQDSVDHFTVVFTNFSQNADSFLWDFGDGTTSNQEHPTHLYPWTNYPACNLVQLIVFNKCGSDTASAIIGFNGYTPPSQVNSSVSNWTVNFDLGNSHSNNDFYWDFGDGNVSSLSSPAHTYISSKPYECYTVKLVYADCGDHVFQKEIAVGNYPASNPCNIINGIQKNQLSTSSIEIYPNPSNGILNVSLKTNQPANLIIEVLDVRGALVYSNIYGTVQGDFIKPIDLTELPSSVYLVKVQLSNEITYHKILLK